MLKFIATTSLVLLIAACGKEIAPDAKPGWTEDKIDALIACVPRDSETCKCAIPKITSRYTPEQVREKSPFVASDMLSIRGGCGADGKSTPATHPAPQPKS